MGPQITMTIVEELLGVPPGYPSWRVADMARRARALPTWLSTAVARGIPIDAGAQDLLDRERRRVASLHQIATDMASAHRVRVLKGVRIAAHLPAEILRQSGDVDLVADDEAAMWQCTRDLVDRFGAIPQGVSVMRGRDSDDVQYGVALKWPAEQAHLDKPMGADVTTCAFAGDFSGVPIRVRPPDDDDLCSLAAVAEEHFQRRYRLKDRLDMLVLAQVLEARFGDDLADAVIATAQTQLLAPELSKLLAGTDERVPLPPRWQQVIAALQPIAEQEKVRRRGAQVGMHQLHFGMPLDRIASAGDRATVIERADGDVITTPVGTCLLVSSPVVDATQQAQAVAFAQSLR